MTKLTSDQADRLNSTAGMPFTPKTKSKDSEFPKAQTTNALVANHTTALMRQALQDTEVILKQVDEIWQAAEDTAIGYFDQRGLQAKGAIASTIMQRMGLTLESARESELDFFEGSTPDIQGKFAQLLTRGHQLTGQRTIDTQAIAEGVE